MEKRSGEEVLDMVGLHERGWGAKRIAQEFGCARNTVRRYLREGGVVAYRQPVRRTAFDGLDDWLSRMHIRASPRQRQTDWFEGMEGAYLRSGGVPTEVLIANAKALVETRELCIKAIHHIDFVTRGVKARIQRLKKKGIKFTGGYGKMTAKDVKFSLERIIKYKSGSMGELGSFDHVEIEDDQTGVVVFNTSYVPVWTLVFPCASGHIVSEQAAMKATKDGRNFGMNPPAFSGRA
ncbi:hypothetical protein ABID25_006365 [Mesorhizobium abyssinicae]